MLKDSVSFSGDKQLLSQLVPHQVLRQVLSSQMIKQKLSFTLDLEISLQIHKLLISWIQPTC